MAGHAVQPAPITLVKQANGGTVGGWRSVTSGVVIGRSTNETAFIAANIETTPRKDSLKLIADVLDTQEGEIANQFLRNLYVLTIYDRRHANCRVGPRSKRTEVCMAIQDYVRSIAATETVSKSEVFRYLEMQFARIDKNHDGQLTAEELEAFTHAIAWPEVNQR
jgi:hypothetical protein